MNKDIELIRALVELGDKATDGPWEMDHGGNQPEIWVFGDAHVATIPRHTLASYTHDGPFICAAANAIPALRAMLARLEKLEFALEKISGDVTRDGKSYGSTHCDVGACQRAAITALKEAQDA